MNRFRQEMMRSATERRHKSVAGLTAKRKVVSLGESPAFGGNFCTGVILHGHEQGLVRHKSRSSAVASAIAENTATAELS